MGKAWTTSLQQILKKDEKTRVRNNHYNMSMVNRMDIQDHDGINWITREWRQEKMILMRAKNLTDKAMSRLFYCRECGSFYVRWCKCDGVSEGMKPAAQGDPARTHMPLLLRQHKVKAEWGTLFFMAGASHAPAFTYSFLMRKCCHATCMPDVGFNWCPAGRMDNSHKKQCSSRYYGHTLIFPGAGGVWPIPFFCPRLIRKPAPGRPSPGLRARSVAPGTC